MSITTAAPAQRNNFLPKFVGNTIEGFNELSEAWVVGCRGVRKTTEGLDKVTTLILSQKTNELLVQLENAPKPTDTLESK